MTEHEAELLDVLEHAAEVDPSKAERIAAAKDIEDEADRVRQLEQLVEALD